MSYKGGFQVIYCGAFRYRYIKLAIPSTHGKMCIKNHRCILLVVNKSRFCFMLGLSPGNAIQYGNTTKAMTEHNFYKLFGNKMQFRPSHESAAMRST